MKDDFIIDNFAIASQAEKIAKKEDGTKKATNPKKQNHKKGAKK